MLDKPVEVNDMPPQYRRMVRLVLQYIYSRNSINVNELPPLIDRVTQQFSNAFLYMPTEIYDIVRSNLVVDEEYIAANDTYIEVYKLTPEEHRRAEDRAYLNRRYKSCKACISIECVCDYSLQCLGDGPHSLGCHGSHE